MRTLLLILCLFAFASCSMFDNCELELSPTSTGLHCESTNYEYNQSRIVNCSNASDGYSTGQHINGLRNINIDSVYCINGVARVAASFYAHNDSTHWYDVKYEWLSSLSIGQTVDYVLPTDTANNSLYYTLKLTAEPNASHANPNSMTIVEIRSFH